MVYRFATENINYEDYSSGRVLYNRKGTTSFPVRLGSEIFQKCFDFLIRNGASKLVNLYDPCCGGAYLLTSLGFLHGENISKIYASDISEETINLAKRNISLLTVSGMDKRINQIKKLSLLYEKDSHFEALNSAKRFMDLIKNRQHEIDFEIFVSDITQATKLVDKVTNVHILISDIPYGNIVEWNDGQSDEEAIKKILTSIYPILAKVAIIALISKKKTKIRHQNYSKVESFSIGKRQITLLNPI